MKRVRSGGTGGLVATSEGEQGFWPSYADMMSAVALILFFLMLLSYIQNLITGNDLQNTQEALEETRIKLASTLTEVEDAQARLLLVSSDLETAQLTLQNQQTEITKKEEEITQYARRIDEYAKELDAYAEEISGQRETIAEQQTLIDEQEDYLAAANTELRQMRTQMQTIAVLRLSILEQIRDSIIEVMGDASKVSIGENGNIILSEGVLFDVGKSDIKPDSRAVLDQLIDVFSKFLADSENARYVDSIVISGHTDSTGDEKSNRELATDRANSVLNYLLTGKNGVLSKYAEYFCAAGYGETRPVETNETDQGRAANRRIEVSMILKDESVLKIVEQYLALELPEVAPAAGTPQG